MQILRHVGVLISFVFLAGTLTACKSGGSSGPGCDSNEREIKIVNNTSRDIWLGITSAAQTAPTPADVSRANQQGTGINCSGGSCPAGGSCNIASNKCYLNIPRIVNPADADHPPFVKQGASISLCVTAVSGAQIQWSGFIFARFGCDSNGNNCQSATCPTDASGNCLPGSGGTPPATGAEFTLQNRALSSDFVDFYDVTMIDGPNLAVSIQPDSTGITSANNPYQCASPGLRTASNDYVRGCNWKLSPPSPAALFRQVPSPETPFSSDQCSNDADCSSGEVCGLALNAVDKQKFGLVCGPLLGYRSPGQICAVAVGNKNPAMIEDNLKCTASGTTDLFGCVGSYATSCYNQAAATASNCCGCPTDSSAPSSKNWPVLSPTQTVNQCKANNPAWQSTVVPWITFLKQACPSAYSFPFDDPTSTFVCTSNGNPNATPGYTVTFSDLQ